MIQDSCPGKEPAEILEMYFQSPDGLVVGSQWEDVSVCDFNLWQETGGSGFKIGSTFSQSPQTCHYRPVLLLIIEETTQSDKHFFISLLLVNAEVHFHFSIFFPKEK